MVALRRRLFTLLALLLSGALLFTGLSDRSSQVRANLLDLVPLNRAESPHSRADDTGLEEEFTLEGRYKLAKVRVLGVPSIMVASPQDDGDQGLIGASMRAKVIEGNLRALYDPNQLCSFSERLTEWLTQKLLGLESTVCSAGRRYGLDRSGEPIDLVVLKDGDGPYELAARLPGREQPFPILTVTRADADINGAKPLALAQDWRLLLEQRVNHARKVYSPQRLVRRFRVTVLIELLVFGLMVGTSILWNRLRQRTTRLQSELLKQRSRNRRFAIRLHAEQALTIGVLLLLLYEVVMMLGIAVMAMPGLVPLGLELLMQPTFAFVKFFLVTLLTFLLRSLATFLLSQWAADVDVSERELARRQQRFISLLRVTHRLINVAGLVLVGIWVLLDIPGVRSVSNSLILAGGALLGALAFVFQGFLRDFVTGLVMLLEDRYAIGDWIEVDGIQGEVVDVGLFSTQIRCLDQRINIVDNSSILQMRNATKLRSGSLITFLISHRQSDLAVVFSTLSDVIETFKDDPIWGDRLIGEPILRGVKRISALGVHMQVLLITRAGEQWATEREFQRLALKELHSRNVEMANGLELAVTEPDDPRRMEG